VLRSKHETGSSGGIGLIPDLTTIADFRKDGIATLGQMELRSRVRKPRAHVHLWSNLIGQLLPTDTKVSRDTLVQLFCASSSGLV
jgi:hypothetical protein